MQQNVGSQQQPKVTRIIVVRDTVSIPAATPSPSAGIRIDWPTTGRVLWAMGGLQGATGADNYWAGLTALGFRIQIKGISEFVTTGLSASYVQFATVFPSAGFRLPINLPVVSNDAWMLYFRNLGAAPFTPDFCFGVRED